MIHGDKGSGLDPRPVEAAVEPEQVSRLDAMTPPTLRTLDAYASGRNSSRQDFRRVGQSQMEATDGVWGTPSPEEPGHPSPPKQVFDPPDGISLSRPFSGHAGQRAAVPGEFCSPPCGGDESTVGRAAFSEWRDFVPARFVEIEGAHDHSSGPWHAETVACAR